MRDIDADTPLADLVADAPGRARVLEEYGLDFCCGGEQTLEEACHTEDLDLAELRSELEAADGAKGDRTRSNFETLTELTDYIVDRHHDFLRDELGPLGDLVDDVLEAHGEAHPELHAVSEHFEELSREIPVHLSEEEQILFPAVRKLESEEATRAELAAAEQVLDGLFDDHDETAGHLEAIREQTDDFAVPNDACSKYENMLERLEALEHDLHLHIHRENHILFPAVEERVAD